MTDRPEIQNSVMTGPYKTNYLEQGEGYPLVFIHGSGPGVSAYANWRLAIPEIAKVAHCYAPDMLGFGYSDKPMDVKYGCELWTQQIVDFLDALGLEKVDLVGNSFGGSLALSMAVNHPDRIRKLVMMGPMGISFDCKSVGLNDVWGYKPSPENMLKMLNLFVDDKSFATEELANVRYQASIQPGFQEVWEVMFQEPLQDMVEDLSFTPEEIANVKHETLIVHGRQDEVIPLNNSFVLSELMENADLHVFAHCGHWSQIEKSKEFAELVSMFVAD